MRKLKSYNKFEIDNLECIFAEVSFVQGPGESEFTENDKVTHIEYYVGITKEHQMFKKGISYGNTKDDQLISRKIFDEELGNINLIEFLQSIIDILDLSENEKINYISKNNLKSQDYAWVSFIGNKEGETYNFLDKAKCYYGGAMSVTNFGEEDAKTGALISIKKIVNYLNNNIGKGIINDTTE